MKNTIKIKKTEKRESERVRKRPHRKLIKDLIKALKSAGSANIRVLENACDTLR